MKIKDNRVRYFIYAAFFMLFVYLGYKVPYCLDEWKWGLPQRVELMKRGFSGYNGRYLGNILALLITRSEVAKTLVISVCMVLIVWLMEMSVRRKTFSEKDKSDPILLLSLILLLLAVPASLYGQSYDGRLLLLITKFRCHCFWSILYGQMSFTEIKWKNTHGFKLWQSSHWEYVSSYSAKI